MRAAGAAARSAAARAAAWLSALAARAAPLCVVAPCADRDSWCGAPGSQADSQEDALTEELFTKLLEHSPDMFVFGNGNTCEYESKSLTRTLGHSLVGPVMLANVHPDDREALGAVVARCTAETLATGKPVSATCTVRFLPRDSRPVLWVEIKSTHMGTRWYCCLTDVSAAKRSERCLHDWLATTSHDARTPLSSIQVSCVLLRERGLLATPHGCDDCAGGCLGKGPEEACDGELLTAIAASASVLLAIVQNVMLLKRLDAGECDLSASVVAPRALVADVCATARVGLAQQAGASLRLDESTPLPPAVVCPAQLVSHVLLCLTAFCTRASRGGEVCVAVRCGAARKSSSKRHKGSPPSGRLMLRLEVAAPALTLSARAMECVFEPYDASGSCLPDDDEQGAGSSAHGGGDSGSGRLGLHVSRRLVEAMGGTLSLRSRPGDGTRFTALIPVALPAEAEPASPAASASGSETPVGSPRRRSEDSGGSLGSPRTLASSSAADTAEPAEPEPEPEDLGIAPFFPADAVQGECWESLKQRGMLREVADLLMTNSPDGYTVGKGRHFIYASPGALRMFRATKEQLLSTAVEDLMHPDDRARTMEEWSEALETSVARGGEPVFRTYHCRLRCCNSDPTSPSFFWSTSSTIVTKTAAPGDQGQWFNIMRDVGDQRRLEASLKHFLHSTMADMLQPLTGIQAASTLLAQRPSVQRDEDASFLVAAISSASRLLGGIVANVLSLRALEAGDVAVRVSPFSVRRLVSSVVSVCRMSLAHATAARVTWLDEDAPLPPLLLGDEDRLAQVLLNLLTNGSKFADGSAVTVSCAVDAPPADAPADAPSTLRIAVADGGRGMSAEECAHAFEPYYRAPSHRGGGTGLGLYICKRFSQALGGSLTLQSAPGRGARFELAVPVRVAPPGAAEAAPPSQPEQPQQTEPAATPAPATAAPPSPPTPPRDGESEPAPRRLRVLLVEDHPLNARLCKRLLETRGNMEVTLADDGDVALRILTGSYDPPALPFDLCLMDMCMPRLDGLQATKQFRAFERRSRPAGERLVVIALSANVFDEAIQDCKAAGMDGFVPKPLRIDMLRAALASTDISF